MVLAGPDVFNINNTVMCAYWWPLITDFFGFDPSGSFYNDCDENMRAVDYNHDAFTNFREFTVVAIDFMGLNGSWPEKATQTNCSACIGMEHYNDVYELTD